MSPPKEGSGGTLHIAAAECSEANTLSSANFEHSDIAYYDVKTGELVGDKAFMFGACFQRGWAPTRLTACRDIVTKHFANSSTPDPPPKEPVAPAPRKRLPR